MAIGKASGMMMKSKSCCCCIVGVGHTNGGSITSSNTCTPPSPPPSPRRGHCRRRIRARTGFFAGSAILRRNVRYLVVLPLLYFCGMMMCVGPFSSPPPPGSVYRSHEVFHELWPHIHSDNSSTTQLQTLWTYTRRLKEQKRCSSTTVGQHFSIANDNEATETNGYLIVEANGGLNQQRSAICNAVAVAGILNAILVIPRFEFNGVWRDPSGFEDIYDEDHFIGTLDGYVKVVRQLPEELMERFGHNIANMPNLRVPAWATAKYYMREVFPVIKEHRVIRLSPFANRLAMNVPPQIQFLRCLANLKALRFSSSITTLANKLVARMKRLSSSTGGKYVSVHLRFEEDMVAFSCCVYDGDDAEKVELDSLRQRSWRGKFKRKDRVVLPGLNRLEGKCPLTPLEVGLMLRGMGFDNTTSIYLASGKIYRAERYLAPLLKIFPQIYVKESLATPNELATFKGYSSRMAALDYTVCLQSEVFVTTQGGNFPHFLMGQRRFLHGGHSKTIKPDKQKLVHLLQDTNISWTDFKHQMEAMLRENDRKGMIVPRVKKFNRKTSIYTYPFPECRCLEQSNDTSMNQLTPTSSIKSRR